MELILRYTLFEGFLAKIVGNILWEYPELSERPIHAEMKGRGILRLKGKKGINSDAERITERIAWTRAAVNAVEPPPQQSRKACDGRPSG